MLLTVHSLMLKDMVIPASPNHPHTVQDMPHALRSLNSKHVLYLNASVIYQNAFVINQSQVLIQKLLKLDMFASLPSEP